MSKYPVLKTLALVQFGTMKEFYTAMGISKPTFTHLMNGSLKWSAKYKNLAMKVLGVEEEGYLFSTKEELSEIGASNLIK